MSALTNEQLELLQRARDGVLMWGGNTALPRLARDVELLAALGLVEPATESPYQVTARGLQVLDALGPARLSNGSDKEVGRLVVGAAMGSLLIDRP